jgi:hypothetical protein
MFENLTYRPVLPSGKASARSCCGSAASQVFRAPARVRCALALEGAVFHPHPEPEVGESNEYEASEDHDWEDAAQSMSMAEENTVGVWHDGHVLRKRGDRWSHGK